MKTRADRLVESTARDLTRLAGIERKIAAIVDAECEDCQSLTLAFLRKQAAGIRRSISGLSPRVLRIARKHAGLG